MCAQKTWTPDRYHEDTYNCYSFVLTFLQSLNYGVLSKTAFNRYVYLTLFVVAPTHTHTHIKFKLKTNRACPFAHIKFICGRRHCAARTSLVLYKYVRI